jgi:hypothetical protein
LLTVVAVVFLFALFVPARDAYYSERRQTEAVMAELKGISNVRLQSHVDVTEGVHATSFTVDACPGSVVELAGVCAYQDSGVFSVSRIGKWSFRISGRRDVGVYVAATGEPVESDYIGCHLRLGVSSPYRELIPFEVNALQDVVDHYQELVDLFESWPREAEPGAVTLEDGTTQYYFVVEEGEAAVPSTPPSI